MLGRQTGCGHHSRSSSFRDRGGPTTVVMALDPNVSPPALCPSVAHDVISTLQLHPCHMRHTQTYLLDFNIHRSLVICVHTNTHIHTDRGGDCCWNPGRRDPDDLLLPLLPVRFRRHERTCPACPRPQPAAVACGPGIHVAPSAKGIGITGISLSHRRHPTLYHGHLCPSF